MLGLPRRQLQGDLPQLLGANHKQRGKDDGRMPNERRRIWLVHPFVSVVRAFAEERVGRSIDHIYTVGKAAAERKRRFAQRERETKPEQHAAMSAFAATFNAKEKSYRLFLYAASPSPPDKVLLPFTQHRTLAALSFCHRLALAPPPPTPHHRSS